MSCYSFFLLTLESGNCCQCLNPRNYVETTRNSPVSSLFAKRQKWTLSTSLTLSSSTDKNGPCALVWTLTENLHIVQKTDMKS